MDLKKILHPMAILYSLVVIVVVFLAVLVAGYEPLSDDFIYPSFVLMPLGFLGIFLRTKLKNEFQLTKSQFFILVYIPVLFSWGVFQFVSRQVEPYSFRYGQCDRKTASLISPVVVDTIVPLFYRLPPLVPIKEKVDAFETKCKWLNIRKELLKDQPSFCSTAPASNQDRLKCFEELKSRIQMRHDLNTDDLTYVTDIEEELNPPPPIPEYADLLKSYETPATPVDVPIAAPGYFPYATAIYVKVLESEKKAIDDWSKSLNSEGFESALFAFIQQNHAIFNGVTYFRQKGFHLAERCIKFPDAKAAQCLQEELAQIPALPVISVQGLVLWWSYGVEKASAQPKGKGARLLGYTMNVFLLEMISVMRQMAHFSELKQIGLTECFEYNESLSLVDQVMKRINSSLQKLKSQKRATTELLLALDMNLQIAQGIRTKLAPACMTRELAEKSK